MTEPHAAPEPAPRSASDSTLPIVVDGDGTAAFRGAPPTLEAWSARYERRAQLGRGGMGTVHLAYDRRIHREIAIKVLIATDPTRAELARFVQEAQVTGQLAHPNIPPIHDLGLTPEGVPYIAMKVVRGTSLKARLDELRAAPTRVHGRLFPLAHRLDVLVKVAEALGYAHAHGVIHRDVKPDNVMIGEFGEVLVMDWGLAKLVGSGSTDDGDDARSPRRVTSDREGAHRTADGAVAGTAAYMSPEQARGEVARLDARADVFALGAVLYEMLTLSPPYAGATQHATLHFAQTAAWVSVAERIRADRPRLGRVPPELAGVAHRALAAHPDDRYPNAISFVADLRAFLAHEPVSAHTDGVVARVAKWTQRHPRAAIALAFALVVCLVAQRAEAVAARQRATNAELSAERDRAALERDRAALEGEAQRARADDLGRLAKRRLTSASREAIDELRRLWAASRAAGESDREFSSALSSVQLDRYIGAYDELFEVDRLNGTPSTSPQHFDRAVLRERRGDLVGAGADLDRAIELDPNDVPTLTNRGSVKSARGDLVGALRDFDRALEIAPGFAIALSNRGVARLARGDVAGARADYDHALEVDPHDAVTLSNRGWLRQSLGDFAGAIADYDRALIASPKLSSALSNRGSARQALGDLDGARIDFDRAVVLDPNAAGAWCGRGAVRLVQGDLDGARTDLDHALALEPSLRTAYHNRGVVRRLQGNLVGARADLDRALELAATDVPAHIQRALVRQAQGDLAGALADATRAIELAPTSGEPRLLRATLYSAQGDAERALADLEGALAADAADWRAAATKGSILAARGDSAGAVTAFEQAFRHCTEPAARAQLTAEIRRLGGSPPR